LKNEVASEDSIACVIKDGKRKRMNTTLVGNEVRREDTDENGEISTKSSIGK